MPLSLIWAQAADGVIGDRGSIPWRLPEDLALFRRLTTGTTVLMGRRTWDSLPERFRPLPDRRNLVLTRQPDWTAPGAEPVARLEAALDVPGSVWVIGGADVYALALPHATSAVVTEVDGTYPGDRFAPALGDPWRLVTTDPTDGWHTSRTGLRYRVHRFDRSV